jgi:hypothetical protein
MLAKLILATLGLTGLTLGSGLSVWIATLDAKDNSGITGTARVESAGKDSVSATINVKGAAANTSLTWAIHSGKCAAPGAMRGAGYSAIQIDSTGAGSATSVVAVAVDGDNSVIVHGSSAGSAVACGDLQPGSE